MAKRRTRKFKRRTTRWSSNIAEFSNQNLSAGAGVFFNSTTLATNPSQTTLGVSQIYTCKNFDINFTIESANSWSLENMTAYIMFVPQGMVVDSNYNLDHPEYILNYKYLGSPTNTGTSVSSESQQFQPTRLRTRMARKLQTGDGIILFIKGLNEGTSTLSYNLSGLVRWWTKAN